MERFKQILIICDAIGNAQKDVLVVKKIIKDRLKASATLLGLTREQKLSVFGIADNVQDQSEVLAHPQYVVVWTQVSQSFKNLKSGSYISRTTDTTFIIHHIIDTYNVKNVQIKQIYQIARLTLYNVSFSSTAHIGFFIRPVKSMLAYKIGGFLSSALKSSFKDRNFRLKINQYKITENK